MGAGASAVRVDHRAELARIQAALDAGPPKGPPKEKKIDFLVRVYAGSKLVALSRDALLGSGLFLVQADGLVRSTGSSSGFLGLTFAEVTDMNRFTRAFAPLNAYLLKARSAYQAGLAGGKSTGYFSFDTRRWRQNSGDDKFVDIASRLVSNKLTREAFDWAVAAIKAEINSGGQRVGINAALRAQVAGKNCYACRNVLGPDWEVGHIRSVKQGGLNDLQNLRPLCQQCNRSMGKMHLEEYMVACDLAGQVDIPEARRKLWRALINLSQATAEFDAEIAGLAVDERLARIGQVLEKVLLRPSP